MSQLVQGMRAGWRGGRGLLRKAPVLGRDRLFESVFLQRRVGCELGYCKGGPAAS